MELYLARHGHVDHSKSIDPFAIGLTGLGREQSLELAAMCERLEIPFIIASTMIRAEETANIISQALPGVTRWDLDEFQAVNSDDLMLDPSAHPSKGAWSEDQLIAGRRRAWIRATAVLPRIEIYMNSYGFERALIIAHEDVINMLLLAWQGQDWRALNDCPPLDYATVTRVVLDGDQALIGPVNTPPGEYRA